MELERLTGLPKVRFDALENVVARPLSLTRATIASDFKGRSCLGSGLQARDPAVAFERARILALLDTFGSQCQAQAQAMSETGHANTAVVAAQLDAVRLLQEAINQG